MPSIDLSEKVKEKLEIFKEEEGIKTYSESVNVLLIYYRQRKNQDSKE